MPMLVATDKSCAGEIKSVEPVESVKPVRTEISESHAKIEAFYLIAGVCCAIIKSTGDNRTEPA